MIFAVAVPEKRELVVVGGDTTEEFRSFVGQITAVAPELLQDTDVTRLVMDRDLSRFKITPTIFEFPSSDDVEEFVEVNKHRLELTSFATAVERQIRMIEADDFNDDSGRTIGEITGLDKHDPFDLRTDEEKAEDEKRMEQMRKKRKAGDLTGDSFGGGAGGPKPDRLTKQLVGEAGTYYRVTVSNTMGNSADEVEAMYQTEDAQERTKVPFEPVYRADEGEGVVFFFKDPVVADRIADDLRDAFVHVATVDVDPVDECGNIVDDEGGLQIRDIKIHVDDETGEVTVERVLADKDLFKSDYYKIVVNDSTGKPLIGKEQYEPILKRAGLADTNRYFGADYRVDPDGGILIKLGGASLRRMKDALEKEDHTLVYISGKDDDGSENPLKIADDDMIAVYFRVEAPERNVDEVIDLITEYNKHKPYRSGNFVGEGDGCWLAYVRKASAEDVVEMLVKKSIPAELVEVDRNGERILEEGIEGVSVIDTGAADVEPPLPWNDGAKEFAAMSEKEQRKALAGRWLFYTARKHDHPTNAVVVHITPRSYFNEHGKMWEGELPIEHLLTDNFEKFGDKVGVYKVKSLDLNTTDFLLGNKANMIESLMLRAHINTLGEKAY